VYDIAKVSRSDDEWCENDENEEDADYIYVNLNENKETFTAYNGTNIWQAIYEENCMLEKMIDTKIDP
jgi:hypothetical protein